jgi:hypothetical protein
MRLSVFKKLEWAEDQALPGATDPTAQRESERFEAELAKVPGWREAHNVLGPLRRDLTLAQRLDTPAKVSAAKDIARILSTHYTGRGGEDGPD